tara:strand:- start:173 stop:544 length:372 start_codon:yes stop_codon:yes gene_type:complete
MAKLLPTRLPIASDEVNPDVFNRLIRVLELNLGQFDPNRTPQFNEAQIAELNFLQGDVIWNTSIGVLQVYVGNYWLQLHEPNTPNEGLEAKGLVGILSVSTGGNISVKIPPVVTGYGIEKYYT